MNTNLIDQLGLLKAQIADLKDQEAAIKAELLLENPAPSKLEGNLFRVSISTSIQRRLDTGLIRKIVPKPLLRRAEKEVTVTSVRVTARKGSRVHDMKAA